MGWLDTLTTKGTDVPVGPVDRSSSSFAGLKLPTAPLPQPPTQTLNLAGTANLIRSYLEQTPPDTDSALLLIRSVDRANLPALRAAFRDCLPADASTDPDQRVIRYLEGLPNIPPERRELIILSLSGRDADVDVAGLYNALEAQRLNTSPEAAELLRGELRAVFLQQLGDTPERIRERIEALNRGINQRELLERWLRECVEQPERGRLQAALVEWDRTITGREGARTLLLDRWLQNNLSEEQRTQFQTFLEAQLPSQPDRLAAEVQRVFGERSRFADLIAARRDGNQHLVTAIDLVEAIQCEGVTPREILVHVMRLTPEERQQVVQAYHARYGEATVTDPAEQWRTLFTALTTHTSSGSTPTPNPWSPTIRNGLERVLRGQAVDQQQLELELSIGALGITETSRRGDRLNVGLADLNFVLTGRNAEQRTDLLRRIETELVRRGILEASEINASTPGAALRAYLRQHSDSPPEELRVLTLRSEHLRELQRLGHLVAHGTTESTRRSAAAQLNSLNGQIEAQRLAFARAETERLAGRPAAAVSTSYFDVHTIRTEDRRSQWADAVDGLFRNGAVAEGRINIFVGQLRGQSARYALIRALAEDLDGDISSTLMTVRGSTSNLRSAQRSLDDIGTWNGASRFFSYMSGTTAEAERAVGRERTRVDSAIRVFTDTQARTATALTALQRGNDESIRLEQAGRLAELFGQPSAQESYNRAEVAFQSVATSLRETRSESVKQRIKANNKYSGELREANERLGKCIESLNSYEEGIIKTGVIVGATAVTLFTGGLGAGVWVGAGSVVAGTSAGGLISMGARNYSAGLQGKQTFSKEVWTQIGEDTFDAFVASVGAKGSASFTQARTAAATTRAQIMKAHTYGNFIAAGTMFAGNTGKSVVSVYGDPFGMTEGALAKREKELGRELNAEERTEVLEKYRLTPGQLTRDAFTYAATAYVGGKISGATHAYGGNFAANGGFVEYAPSVFTKTLGVTNFVGQTGVGVGGNGLNYLYKEAGWEKEFHFDAGLLVAPAGNLSFGGHKGRAPAGERVQPTTVAHVPALEPVHLTPGRTTVVAAEPHATTGPRVAATTEPAVHTGGTGTRAATEPVVTPHETAIRRQADAHAALVEAQRVGDPVRIMELEGAYMRARRASLTAEQEHIAARQAAGENVSAERLDHARRVSEHTREELALHRERVASPTGEEAVRRAQLERDHAAAALAHHVEQHGAAPTGEHAHQRALLEAEVARTTSATTSSGGPGRGRGRRPLSEEARAAIEERRTAMDNHETELRRFREEHPNWETDPNHRARGHQLEDAALQARRSYEDVTYEHVTANLREELATARGRRRQRIEQELHAMEEQHGQRPVRRAAEDLANFNARHPNANAEPALRQQLRALEDAVHQAQATQLTAERQRLQQQLDALPDTVRNAARRTELEQQIGRTEVRLAELTYERAQTATNRHRADTVEHDIGSSRRRATNDAAWEQRRTLLDAELTARENLAARRLLEEQRNPANDSASRSRLEQRQLELVEAQAARAQLGTAERPGPRIAYEQALNEHERFAAPLRQATELHEAYRARYGDNHPETLAARRIMERTQQRFLLDETRARVRLLEHEIALRNAEDGHIRERLGLGPNDPLPASEERQRRPLSRMQDELANARTNERRAEGSGLKKKLLLGLGAGAAAYFALETAKTLVNAGNAFDGLDFYDNDHGYMFGRSADGGPVDEMMYTRMTQTNPAEWLDIARSMLRDAYPGDLLSDNDIERFAQRIIRAGNGSVPSQLAIHEIILEADSVATTGASIRGRLRSQGAPQTDASRPRHGINGFFDIEQLRSEGLIKAPQR